MEMKTLTKGLSIALVFVMTVFSSARVQAACIRQDCNFIPYVERSGPLRIVSQEVTSGKVGYSVMGEVENIGQSAVADPVIVARIFDSQGEREVITGTTFVPVIFPGKFSSFEIPYAIGSGQGVIVAARVMSVQVVTQTALTLLDSEVIRYFDDGDAPATIYVTYRVANTGSITASAPTLYVWRRSGGSLSRVSLPAIAAGQSLTQEFRYNRVSRESLRSVAYGRVVP